jgi:ribA/ribD-fused uncharacterized protein
MAITEFRNKWVKLGNYSLCTVFYSGHAYTSIEHAYQAQKSLDPAIQKMVRDCPTPNTAKQMARKVQLRPDWEQVKNGIMLELLREKFSSEPERSILLSTGAENLVEGNWWGDRYWGQCPVGNGKNMLGLMLMHVRAELNSGQQMPFPHATVNMLLEYGDECV